MITEMAVLQIRDNENIHFEKAFDHAKNIIRAMKGYIEHELLKCLEKGNKYLLIVRWQTLEDHTEGFRKHEKYAVGKSLLHHFYDPFPIVEHYLSIK